MATHDRPSRVGHAFQRELGEVLNRGLKDPRIKGLVTVTGVKMAPDLRDVTAYVSVLGEERVRVETLEGLTAATSYLQREVSKRLKLRYVPHLRFAYDPSVAEGDKIERIFKELKEKKEPDEGTPKEPF
jgi:ribosome-binding factor A